MVNNLATDMSLVKLLFLFLLKLVVIFKLIPDYTDHDLNFNSLELRMSSQELDRFLLFYFR